MKIYTRTGDAGQTGLWGGKRVPKNHPRVRAYGEIDELNSALGAAIAALPDTKVFAPLKERLARVQTELFVAGALLATPAADIPKLKAPLNRLEPGAPARLEREIDGMTAELAALRRFILPGGSFPAALFHLARTVCRRAEREAISLGEKDALPDGLVVYLNRLSDYLFTVARWVNLKMKTAEVEWQGQADS